MSCCFKVINQHGAEICCDSTGTNGNGVATGQYWPLIQNPSTGARQWLSAWTIDGVPTFSFVDEHPKALGDDGLWRKLFFETVDGQPALYIDDSADTLPSYELIVKNMDDGELYKVKTHLKDGIQVPYLDPV